MSIHIRGLNFDLSNTGNRPQKEPTLHITKLGGKPRRMYGRQVVRDGSYSQLTLSNKYMLLSLICLISDGQPLTYSIKYAPQIQRCMPKEIQMLCG